MKSEHHFTRSTVTAVWTVAMLGLAVWFAIAWGGHALLSDSSEWLFARIDPLIASAAWDLRLERLFAGAESFGTLALWAVWALGSLGLLLTVSFATVLYLRSQRAMSAAR
jgi:hypothetical protein